MSVLSFVTQRVSQALEKCELTFVESSPINIEKAGKEHTDYCKMLEGCGAQVITLEDNEESPDSVFVEDPIIVFDEIAVMTSMGVESRRREGAALATFFKRYRQLEQITLPAKIEGGDVLRIGRTIYVGESPRTDSTGVEALASIMSRFGYETIPVPVSGCLHLKTGCTALDEQTVIINPDWVDPQPFEPFTKLTTLSEEPFGTNVLPVNGTICMNEAFPATIEMVRSHGYRVTSTDISEFVKAEAGLTCMSVPFNQ
jgi:dimethylargininase